MRSFKTVLMVAAAAAISMPATANIGTKSGFTINNPFTYTGYTEMLTQFSDAFNAQSGGCLTLTTATKRGEAETSTFFQNINNLIQRRDPTSTAAQTDTSVPMATIEKIRPRPAIIMGNKMGERPPNLSADASISCPSTMVARMVAT